MGLGSRLRRAVKRAASPIVKAAKPLERAAGAVYHSSAGRLVEKAVAVTTAPVVVPAAILAGRRDIARRQIGGVKLNLATGAAGGAVIAAAMGGPAAGAVVGKLAAAGVPLVGGALDKIGGKEPEPEPAPVESIPVAAASSPGTAGAQIHTPRKGAIARFLAWLFGEA